MRVDFRVEVSKVRRRNALRPACRAALGLVGALSLGGLAACGEPDADPFAGPKGVDVGEDPPASLADFNLMRWDGERVRYAPGVVPYELNTALFSDYSVKQRAVFLPEGSRATYRDNEVLEFPVGTVILKTFLFPEDVRNPEEKLDIIETRVLIRYPEGWRTYPYIWNDDDSDATLQVGGRALVVDFIDEDGAPRTANYLVPQRNQCVTCHELKDETGARYLTPIGPKARHLNLEHDYGAGPVNQLEHLAAQGMLEALPAISEVHAAFDFREVDLDQIDGMDWPELNRAARDYLDINCAHCHNPDGVNGISSQMFLNHDNESDFNLGVCKQPGSAGKGSGGRTYDIVPGDPEASILWYRMETEDVGSMMPALGRSLAHTRGNALIYAWIAGLDLPPCSDAG